MRRWLRRMLRRLFGRMPARSLAWDGRRLPFVRAPGRTLWRWTTAFTVGLLGLSPWPVSATAAPSSVGREPAALGLSPDGTAVVAVAGRAAPELWEAFFRLDGKQVEVFGPKSPAPSAAERR
ncbi:MAG: hypothetical protein IMX05_06670 [Hydrogenibacillus schlegelii]|nr:hypothetical protein [Hydrogenibacillus schlegelii]